MHRHHAWTWNFIFDRTDSGGTLKMMTLLDEYSRPSLAIQVERQITAAQVLGVLEQAMIQYGVPGYIRNDNGPEFIAAKVQQWLANNQIKAIYIDPGNPWQNGYIESFHSRFRDECLSREMLLNLRQARVVIAVWPNITIDKDPIVDSAILARKTIYKPKYSHLNWANY